MAWIVRIQVSDMDPRDQAEMETALLKLKNRRPEWVDRIEELSRVQTRQLLRENELSHASFPGGEVHAVTMPEEITASLPRYAEKLGRALYYKHVGKVLPNTGHVEVRVLTNVQFTSPSFPLDDFNILTVQPPLSRSGQNLQDQFVYRCGVAVGGEGAGFLVQFRESVVMVILVAADKAKFEERRLDRVETHGEE